MDEVDQALWAVEGIALIVLAAGSAMRVIRGRRTRDALAAIVLDLARGTEAGRLQDRLRSMLGDPGLALAYPTGDGRLVDATGAPAPSLDGPGRRITPLVRDGDVVAVIGHRAGLEHDADRMAAIATGAGLALDNERLLAESRARLADIRASRARVVEAGDRERARLERDLHDGAQQRLAGLALAVRMTRSALPPGQAGMVGPSVEPDAAAALEDAEAEVRQRSPTSARSRMASTLPSWPTWGWGLRQPRSPRPGMSPSSSRRCPPAGCPSPWRRRRTSSSRRRPPAPVPARPAPTARASTTGSGCASPSMASTRRVLDLTDLEDRVGALDGTLTMTTVDDAMVIEVDLPCGS